MLPLLGLKAVHVARAHLAIVVRCQALLPLLRLLLPLLLAATCCYLLLMLLLLPPLPLPLLLPSM